MPRLASAIFMFLVLLVCFASGVWWYTYTSSLNQLADRGRSDLSLASDRLVSELQQYRELAVLMAEHPTLVAALDRNENRGAATNVLLRTADKTGTLDVHLLDSHGDIVLSSNRGELPLPSNRALKPSFQRAMQGALGAHHEQTDSKEGRSFTFSSPVFGAGGQVIGAVDVDVNIWAVEAEWLGDPQAVYFTDDLGVVFVSNRTELLFRARKNPDLASPERLALFGYNPEALQPFLDFSTREIGRNEVWAIDGGPYLPETALHLTQELPVIDMTGELLLDVGPAQRLALLQSAVAAALALVFGGMLLILSERRRALTARLGIEAAAKEQLEQRVIERTRELSDANSALRHEIIERKEAETALKKAQSDLVQAGKLSALGKMSAGLSHELNQPLMAIRSFAENAEVLMERGAHDKAAQNLTRISDLGRRMGRIIKNLRAFAKQENEPMTDVNIVAVMDAVLEISEARIAQEAVTLHWARPVQPVAVRGGEVRLQQVMLNLVTNALDSMADSADRQLHLSVEQGDQVIHVKVRDTGSGIVEPEKIFDPFYSTKEVGGSEGMGLGLSISYGLVQSFGGAIRGRNHAEGGAVFTVELTAGTWAVAA